MEKKTVIIEKIILELNDCDQNILRTAYDILMGIVNELEYNQSFMDGTGCCIFEQDIREACDVLERIADTDEIEIKKYE